MHMGGAAENVAVFGDEPSAFGHDGAFGAAGFFDELPPLLKAPVTPAIRATTAMTTTVTIRVRRRDWRRRAATIACWRAWRPLFFRCLFCVAIGENRIRYREPDRV